MTRERLVLKNDFHNTQVALTLTDGKLTARQAKKAQKALCGLTGCTCGDDFGARGPQHDMYGQRISIYPLTAETYEVSVI